MGAILAVIIGLAYPLMYFGKRVRHYTMQQLAYHHLADFSGKRRSESDS